MNRYETLTAARLEDLQWLVDTGESFSGAAARIGIDERALERWCYKHNARHLYLQLRAREPLPANAVGAPAAKRRRKVA